MNGQRAFSVGRTGANKSANPRAHRGRIMSRNAIVMSPADDLVPPSVRQLGSTWNPESNRNAEGTPDNGAVFHRCEGIVLIGIEVRRSIIELRHAIMPRELRPQR